MSPTELMEVVRWVEDRWPQARGFKNPDRVADDFRHVPKAAAVEAARQHYESGNRTPPTYAELRKEALRIASYRGWIDPTVNDCDVRGQHGPWAVETPMTDTSIPSGYREATCLGCGLVKRDIASKLKTVGEAETTEPLPEPM